MRRYIKKELIEITKMLLEATKAIQDSLGTAEPSHLIDVLTDCQQSGIHIGERIEASEGEGTKTVGFIEKYCDEIYQLSLALEDNSKAKSLIKDIDNLLHMILSSITNDIPDDKKEVVFLPYSASMWDSLESVWMAASEDADCNTYVIPIPYYYKNPDGTLGQMHYEGDEYPDYVPITSWEEYNIAKMRPDIIYIHNPYDNFNKSTSVHPDFYSKKIKDYTDMLVYIPYFVTYGDVPEHFCVLPGTMYAHRVIVQTEREKLTYIRELSKLERENNLKGYFGNLEEKLLVLGSPKFDKVAATTRENITIPKEWEKLIEKPDGTRKKVVLYNTTIQALLNNDANYLDKLRDVLNLFYEKRNEITVLWRPHPLIETNIASMKPKLLEPYKAILKEYKSKEYGIYDDTADLHRAIAISDAYYGDHSSLVVLYKETGKPIMIQNVEV